MSIFVDLHAVAAKLSSEDNRPICACCGKGRLGIAVTGTEHQRLGGQAGRETVGSGARVQYRGQLVGLDQNQLGAVFGEIGIRPEDLRNRLADLA